MNVYYLLFFFLYAAEFPQNGYANSIGPIGLPSEEVTVLVGHKVL